MKCDLAIKKKDKILSFVATWKDLNVALSVISQTRDPKHHIFSIIYGNHLLQSESTKWQSQF